MKQGTQRHGSLLILALLLSGCVRSPTEPVPVYSVTVSVRGPGRLAGHPGMRLLDTTLRRDTVLHLAAAPDSDAIFLHWSGDLSSTDSTLSIRVVRDLSLIASFSSEPPGLVPVPSKGRTFMMGSEKLNETPVHPVTLSYDYFLSATEITREEYHEVLSGTAYDGSDPDKPITGITWYDAVLFCNAKSKHEGLDTVYTYSSHCTDRELCPVVLEDLEIHYERFGYRLPTEAEWELGCGGGTNNESRWGAGEPGEYAWYSANSGDSIHEVAALKPNRYGLYDMAGNAAEWVNNWLYEYPETTETDPVGPFSRPYAEYEETELRPVRGGSFKLGTFSMRCSDRGGSLYDIWPTAARDDIGFRVACGAFFPGTTPQNDSLTGSRVEGLEINATKTELISFLGTHHAKLVFVQKDGAGHALCWIDFSEASPRVRFMEDRKPVNAPAISPDGSFAAYSSKGEGSRGPSQITTVGLDSSMIRWTSDPSAPAYLPRWWVSPATGDTFLVYTDGASFNTSEAWSSERTLRQRISGGRPLGEPEVITDEGSYHGGLSRDGAYLATGYPNAYFYDLNVGARHRYYTADQIGYSRDVQVCNVSITPSTEKVDEIMLLDFGSPGVSEFVGAAYRLHQVGVICNSNPFGQSVISNWFRVEDDRDRFNDLEWSNHPRFAATMVVDRHDPEAPKRITLVDLETKDLRTVVTGQSIRYPWLWIDPAFVSESPDPYFFFGRYDLPMMGGPQVTMDRKWKMLLKYRERFGALFMGSSVVKHGLNPEYVTAVSGVNLASDGLPYAHAMILAEDYIGMKGLDCRLVLIDCSTGFREEYADRETLQKWGFCASRGYQFDRENDFWRDGFPGPVVEKIEAYDSSIWEGYRNDGYVERPRSGTWGEPILSDMAPQDSTIIRGSIQRIAETAENLGSRGVHLLVVAFPQHPGYRDMGQYGRYGPSLAMFARVRGWFAELEEANPYFHFYDGNMDGLHGLDSTDFWDCNHLSASGAQKFGARVDSIIATFGLP